MLSACVKEEKPPSRSPTASGKASGVGIIPVGFTSFPASSPNGPVPRWALCLPAFFPALKNKVDEEGLVNS